jgi:hypothetical protein
LAGFGALGGIIPFGDRAMGVCGLPARFGQSERRILAQTETAAPTGIVDPHNPCSGERAVRSGVDAQNEACGAVDGMLARRGGARGAVGSDLHRLSRVDQPWTSWLEQS